MSSTVRWKIVAVTLLVAGLACRPDDRVQLPLDGIAPGGAVVLSFVDDGRQYFVESTTEPSGLRIGTGDVHMLAYDESPEALRLPRGRLPSDLKGASCRVLFPKRAERFVVEEAAWRSIHPPESAPRAIFDGLLPDRSPRCDVCPSLVPERVLVAEHGRVEGAAKLESGALFVSNRSGFYIVDESSSREIAGCNARDLRSVLALGGDRYWAGEAGGRLVRLSIDEAAAECTVETSSRAPGRTLDGRRPTAIGLAPGETEDSVYVLGNDGSLHRFDASGWTRLAELELHPSDREDGWCRAGGLVRLGPADLVFHCGWNRLVRWSRGTLDTHVIPLEPPAILNRDSEDRLEMLSMVAGFGLALSDRGGWLYKIDEALNASGELTFPDAVGSASAYGEGLVAALDGGRVSHWHPDLGTCAEPIELLHSLGSPGHYLFVDGWDVRVADFAGDNDSLGGVDWLRYDGP